MKIAVKHSGVAHSLRRKLLLPLVIIGVVLTALAIWTANQRLRQQLIEKLSYRAELIANMVNYAAEGLSRSGELQRIVTSLGAEYEVETVLVVAGTPGHVLASTKSLYLNKPLEELPNTDIVDLISKVLKSHQNYEHINEAENSYEIVVPLILSSASADEKSLLSGVVFVQLDSKPTQQAITNAAFELSSWLAGLLLTLTMSSFLLLKYHVIRPVELIVKRVRSFQPGKPWRLQEIKYDDEIGLLAKTLEAQQNELAESEERFRIMANTAPVLVWISGTNKQCFWFNQVWLDFTGRSMEQEIGNGWVEGVHLEDVEKCLEIYTSHFDRHTEFKMDYRLKRHDDQYRWIHDHGVPRFDNNDNFLGYIGSCIDVTDQKESEQRLLESEQRWHFALEGAGDGVWDWDIAGGRMTFSKRWYEIQGFQEGSIGPAVSAWRELIHPEDISLAEMALQKHFEGKTSNFSCEHRVRCKNGDYKWILGRGMIVARDNHGNPTRAIGTNTDITDRKVTELERNQLLAIITEAPDLIASSDMQTHVTFLNPAGAKLIGLTENADPTSLMIKDLHPEWAAKRVLEEGIPAVMKQGYWQDETALINKVNGHEIPVSQLLLLHRDRNGVPLQLSTIIRDITDRKNWERTLATDKQKFESLFQLSPVGKALVDHETGAFLEVNDAVLRSSGYTRKEFLELTFWDITPIEYQDQEQKQIAELNETGRFGPNEKEYINKHGVRYPIRISGFLVTQPDGKKIVWGIIEDLTDQKKTQQALIQAKNAAETLARSKSEFLTNMSHEIRTPMSAIIGLLQLAMNKDVSDEVRDYLEKIYSSSDSLLGILNDILDVSKMEAGKLQIMNQHFDLVKIVENLNNMFSHRADEKCLALTIEVAQDVPTNLIGDSLRLQQVLSNLLGNAIKFTDRGRVIIKIKLLDAANGHARLHFSVSDTGIGISPEDQAKLFQSFNQIDNSATRRFGGTGLGLVISRNLLRLMDSKLHLESAQGQGSIFTFELQFSVDSDELKPEVNSNNVDQQAGALSQVLYERGKALSGTRVLLAEDNRINQLVVKKYLELSGIDVDIANTGKEVLILLEQFNYDAVLMDVHMPEMGGIEVTQIIRSQPRFKNLPIIAQTAGVTREEIDSTLTSGMDDIITKPIKAESLIEILAKWIKPNA